MSGFRVSRKAVADLDEIWRFIARDSVERADRFTDHLASKYSLLAEFPLIGQNRDDLAPGVRSLPVGNYLIFYRATSKPIEIVRVLHGARDLDALFRTREEK